MYMYTKIHSIVLSLWLWRTLTNIDERGRGGRKGGRGEREDIDKGSRKIVVYT